uniref:Pleckstrin homology domain containing J1 n=1 Tax=Callorhinchus milii TaxID=7868 RepID=A0A4W3H976_CALMI
MRYNEKELAFLSKLPAEKAAQLHMRGPKRGDAVKHRLVKLVVNFLFYFRIDEEEPAGALLLEQCKIQREEEASFSLGNFIVVFFTYLLFSINRNEFATFSPGFDYLVVYLGKRPIKYSKHMVIILLIVSQLNNKHMPLSKQSNRIVTII